MREVLRSCFKLSSSQYLLCRVCCDVEDQLSERKLSRCVGILHRRTWILLNYVLVDLLLLWIEFTSKNLCFPTHCLNINSDIFSLKRSTSVARLDASLALASIDTCLFRFISWKSMHFQNILLKISWARYFLLISFVFVMFAIFNYLRD